MATVHLGMHPLAQPQPSLRLLQHSRTNLGDLKSQIAKQLGAERAQRYFSYLNGLLSRMLSKPEFNKLCLLTLGRENLHLHNQLVRSILRNACQAKVPPSVNHEKVVQKPTTAFNSLQTRGTSMPISSNGGILPPSPYKFRTGAQNRHVKGCTSSLGTNGGAEVVPLQAVVPYDEVVSKENSDLSPSNLKRLQHQQDGPAEQLAKRPRLDKPSLHDQVIIHGNDLVEVATVENKDKLDNWYSSRGPLRAPLGIPFCSASIDAARRSLLPTAGASIGGFSSSYGCGELCHTEILKNRMGKIAEAQGLGGVTVDCANLLNNSLDAYMRRLIMSCVKLVGARTGNELTKQPVSRLQPCRKPIIGTGAGNNVQVQSVDGLSECSHELKNCCSISVQDFKVAMEINPWQLGEDWSLLLEKICVHSFEE